MEQAVQTSIILPYLICEGEVVRTLCLGQIQDRYRWLRRVQGQDFVVNGLEGLDRAAKQQHVCTMHRKGLGGGAADSGSGSGHQDYPVREKVCARPIPSRLKRLHGLLFNEVWPRPLHPRRGL